MKTNRIIWIGLLLIAGMSQAAAQQVSTMYFLENAPMRHTVNPAFQPVSEGYVNFTPLGYTSFWLGNNSLTMSDAIMNVNGQTVTALHPSVDRASALKPLREFTLVDGDFTLDLLSFGFRHKKKGYVHIGIMERIDAGAGVPKDVFSFVLGGGMTDLTGVNTVNLKNTMVVATAYTEISGGYSYKINDQWTVGGKLKVLLGQVKANANFDKMNLDASYQQWHLYGQGGLTLAAPLNLSALPEQLNSTTLEKFNSAELTNGLTIKDYLTPQGYGAGVDLGFTYKPHPQVQITAAVNDLGFVVWKGANYTMAVDRTFNGVDGLKYSDYANKGNNYQFDTNKLFDDVFASMSTLTQGLHSTNKTTTFTRMISTKLNVGVDANFCNNILGVGIVSKTRLYNNRLYEEVTIGGALRPCNWFNLAVSYSLVNNGKYSNIGAGLSFMPYDGINMTLAMDYIPTSFVKYNNIPIPYKDKGVNLALGFSIVWGTNKKEEAPVEVKYIEVAPVPVPTIADKEDFSVALIKLKPERKFDTDGDGLYDFEDECPYQYGPRENKGCPAVKKEVKNLLQKAMQGIQFETGKTVIKKDSYPLLNLIAQVFIENPSYIIEVQGHTDNTGKEEKNMEISQRRADAVMDYLVKAGVAPERMTAKGYGPTVPIADNATKEGRALNRRVEFNITFEQVSYEEVFDRAE